MKSAYEKAGGTYRKQGDYLVPDIEIPESKSRAVGLWGRRRLSYLKEHRRGTYSRLQLTGKLFDDLCEAEDRAKVLMEEIVTAMAKADGTDEALKARDQMAWVGRMNNYRSCAEEIVFREVILR